MKAKSTKGFVGVDMAVAIVAVILFTGLIVSLMYNTYLENVKIKREALATIYLTEVFENIAIADYDAVTTENANTFIPADLNEKGYKVDLTINSNLNLPDGRDEDIVKQIQAVIHYRIGNKEYQHTLERLKVKE